MVADNMAHYMVPQECGAKEEVRWAKVTDRKGRGMLFEMDPENGPMMFSALPYTPHEMENAMHPYELPEVHYTVVRAAKGQMVLQVMTAGVHGFMRNICSKSMKK